MLRAWTAARMGIASAVAFVCFSLCPLRGQSVTQTVQGRVSDDTGAVIPGATLTLTNVDTGVLIETRTNATGNYNFTLVPVGNYRIGCKAENFKQGIANNVRVETAGQVRQDFQLELGAVSETIEVKASGGVLQTDSPVVGSGFEQKRVNELPLPNRNMIHLAVQMPGVQYGFKTGMRDGSGGFPVPGRSYSVIANGQREIHSVVSMDGANAMNPLGGRVMSVPSIEAIEEFRIQTNAYSAEHGFGGGAVTQITLKSGTNDLHGTLYHFLRNDALNAEDYFLNFELAPGVERQAKDPLRRNEFGAVFTGPIIKNKTFWAFNYDALRLRDSSPATEKYPLPAFRNGDFSELLTGTLNPETGKLFRAPIVVYDAATGDPFPNNTIPSTMLHPGMQNVLDQFVPQAEFRQADPLDFTARGLTRNVVDTDYWYGRIDHVFGRNNRMFARLGFSDTKTENNATSGALAAPLNPNFRRFLESKDYNLASQWVKNITATTVSELRFGFSTYSGRLTNPRTHDSSFDMDALGIGHMRVFGDGKRELTDEEQGVIRLSGMPFFVGETSQFDRDSTFQAGEHVSMFRGSHNIKIGFEWFQIRIKRAAANRSVGQYAFGPNEAGSALAAALLGRPRRTLTAEGLPTTYPLVNRFGGYFNDDWKATPKLTVNLGLRYDYNGWPVAREGTQRTLDLPDHRDILGFRGAGYRTSDGRLIPTLVPEFVDERGAVKLMKQNAWRFFMPRLGIAYRLTPKTVLRTGAGWFDNLDHQNTFTILNLNPPRSGSTQFDANTVSAGTMPVVGADGETYDIQTRQYKPGTHALTLDDPFLEYVGGDPVRGAANLLGVPPDRKNGAVWKWSFDLQRELPGKAVATIGYVGSKGTHVSNSMRNFNNALPSPDTDHQPRRAFPEFYDPATPELGVQQLGTIRYLDSFGESFYHGLQTKLERRFSNGLAFGLAYTFSKAHGDGENGGQESPFIQDPWDRRASRGPFRFDQKHNFAANWVWELPGQGLPGFARQVLGGWQMNGTLALRTGFPFSVLLGQDVLNLGSGREQRPDRISSGFLDNPTRKLWFDTQAYRRVTCQLPEREDLCRFGNAGYNHLRTAPARVANLSVYKTFGVTEQVRLQFRAEAYNATNSPYWGDPGQLTFSSNDTLEPDGARNGEVRSLSSDMRIVQLGLRLLF